VGFVPTMGFLHEGHRALVDRSKNDGNYQTWVSLFVNPTQFNQPDDLEKYPRDLNRDLTLLESWGANLVFTPNAEEMYADKYRYSVREAQLSKELCGQSRPGHFEGVLTVVLKLFNLVQPTRAYFGEKDYQQLELVCGMVKALFLDIDVVGVPTKRLSSGLALSSRNARLEDGDLQRASLIYKLLSDPTQTTETIVRELTSKGFDVDYVHELMGRRFAAASLSGVRLIDNVEVPL
jgi:pantoate--beta-alanine ligase